MKKIILSVALIAASFTTVAQVGIGTTTPSTALEIHDNNDDYNAAVRIVNENTTSATGHHYLHFGLIGSVATAVPTWVNAGVLESTTDGGLILASYSPVGQIKFEVNARSVSAMLIDANGSVGIGVPFGTTPTSKLQVVGLPVHADNAAAVAAGLTSGSFYHNGVDGMVRVVL